MKLEIEGKPLAYVVKNSIKTVLVDIEGTTTPIVFVTEVLFPYAKDNVESYLSRNWENAEVQKDVEALRSLATDDISSGTRDVPLILPNGAKEAVVESVVKNVRWQMSQDRKSTALKQLQGHIWRSAYKDGSIKGEVYDDVPDTLRSLKNDGKNVYVYSSGSVEAQKLLFGYSSKGDLCPLFSGYFDIKIGSKRASSSYTAIAEFIEQKPQDVLFLTDIFAEAQAANDAGMKVCIVLRPGNKPLQKDELERFSTIKSFDDLLTDEVERKRQKIDSQT